MRFLYFPSPSPCYSILFISCLFCAPDAYSCLGALEEESAVTPVPIVLPPSLSDKTPCSPDTVLAELVEVLLREGAESPSNDLPEELDYLEISHDSDDSDATSLVSEEEPLDLRPYLSRQGCEAIPVDSPVISLSSESWEAVSGDYTHFSMGGSVSSSPWILRLYGFGFELNLGGVLIPTKSFSLAAAYALGLTTQDRLTLGDLAAIENELVQKASGGRLRHRVQECLNGLKRDAQEGYYLNLDPTMPLEVMLPILKKLGRKGVGYCF